MRRSLTQMPEMIRSDKHPCFYSFQALANSDFRVSEIRIICKIGRLNDLDLIFDILAAGFPGLSLIMAKIEDQLVFLQVDAHLSAFLHTAK